MSFLSNFLRSISTEAKAEPEPKAKAEPEPEPKAKAEPEPETEVKEETPSSYTSTTTFGNAASNAAAKEYLATRQMVAAALAEDAACRHPGVTTGLYGIADLAPFTRLGHGVPTIRCANDSEMCTFVRADDDAAFITRFRETARCFTSFDLKAHGLVLAGGAAAAHLMHNKNRTTAYHDYDMFLVGHADDDAARAVITALAEHLGGQWPTMEVYRTDKCITFYDGATTNTLWNSPEQGNVAPMGIVVQVILRKYSTLGEIIHGFDLGSSAVAFDGERVWMTGLGKLAAEHGINILNLPSRRSSYESRLARYFDRGYDLVLPNLNASKISNRRIPYIGFSNIPAFNCPCHIKVYNITATRPHLNHWGQSGNNVEECKDLESTSEYALGHVCYGNKLNLLSRNVRAIADNRPAGLCAWARYSADIDIFDIQPQLNGKTLASMCTSSFMAGNVRVKMLKALLGADRALELINAYMESGAQPTQDEINVHVANRMAELLAKQTVIPFVFMTVEDRTALCGPFPRDLVSAADWYGSAYRA
jgi:hypothetical protein